MSAEKNSILYMTNYGDWKHYMSHHLVKQYSLPPIFFTAQQYPEVVEVKTGYVHKLTQLFYIHIPIGEDGNLFEQLEYPDIKQIDTVHDYATPPSTPAIVSTTSSTSQFSENPSQNALQANHMLQIILFNNKKSIKQINYLKRFQKL